MNYIISLRIKPDTGKVYNLRVEFEADNMADAIRTLAEDADRHERNYQEMREGGG